MERERGRVMGRSAEMGNILPWPGTTFPFPEGVGVFKINGRNGENTGGGGVVE